MTQRITNVNKSLVNLNGDLHTHSDTVDDQLKTVEGNVKDLHEKLNAFESHPPTIGEVRGELPDQ